MKDEINYSEMLFNRDERLLNYITNLQKENKQLKKKYENAVADYELEKYKNSKAIEVLKEIEGCDCYIKEVLEILGDKENE